jgi:hypothetical protein
LPSALAGHDRRQAPCFDPSKQSQQLGPDHGLILQRSEEDFNRIEDNAPGFDGVDGVAEADKKAFQVERAGFYKVVALQMDMIDDDLALFLQLFQVVAERCDVLGQVLLGFLKGEKHAGFVVGEGSVDDEFKAEDGLA